MTDTASFSLPDVGSLQPPPDLPDVGSLTEAPQNPGVVSPSFRGFRGGVPNISPGVVARLRDSDAVSNVIGAAAKGAAEGFGSAPLGFSPENQQMLVNAGIFPSKVDQTTPSVAGTLRFFNQSLIAPAAAIGDAFLRLFPAAIESARQGVTQAAKEAGAEAGPGGQAEQIGQEAAAGVEFLGTDAHVNMMLMSRAQYAEATRIAPNPTGGFYDQRIGPVPDHVEAAQQAATVAQHYGIPEAAPAITAAYEKGILPAEIFHDAKTNPTVLADLVEGKVPGAYPTENWAPEPPVASALSESDAAAANITAAGGKVRDVPIGHMITPDGRGVEPFVRGRPIPNHYETAIDAGYLPPERMPTPGTLVPDADKIVNGMLQRGWIRNNSSGGHVSLSVYNINDVKDNLQKTLESYVGPSTKSVFIDEIGTGKSYRFEGKDLIDNSFKLNKTLRNAQVLTGTPAEIETLGAPKGAASAESAPAPGTTEAPKATGPTRLRPITDNAERTVSGLAESAEASAVNKQLVENFGDLPEMGVAKDVTQGPKAVALLDKDPDLAQAIAMGTKQPPPGTLASAVYVAVKNRAEADGNIELLRQLGTQSQFLGQARRMGQEISYLRNVNPENDPVAAIAQVQDARAAALKAKGIDVQKGIADEVAAAQQITRQARAASSAPNVWADFISSITCKE